MRPALPTLLLFAVALVPSLGRAQLPSDGKSSYSRDDRIRIPFELRAGGLATSVKLFSSFDGGGWQEYETARAGMKKEFIFKADRDGPYSFATMTLFSDGTSDPSGKDRLVEQRRVVVDRTPPKIVSVRAIVTSDGAAGLEWDATDDNMDPRGVHLEFRWAGDLNYQPIDKGVPFAPRDHRHWQMRANDRMQVRVIATDRAGNRATSDPVWVSLKDGDKGSEPFPSRPAADSTTGSRDGSIAPATGTKPLQASVHYVKSREVTLNSNASVGPSGLTRATLWAADDKLVWQTPPGGELGPKPAPEAVAPDRPRIIPLNFTYKAEKDGTYNFIIVVENHRGPSRRAPKNNDPGDIQVVVDTTPPVVEILSMKVSENGDRGAVVDIRWKATDLNIAATPIMLEYRPANKDQSSWKDIGPGWMDNTGQYTWTAPTGESHEFDIRIRCKDRAGNEGMKIAEKPVNTDLSRPTIEYGDVVPGVSGTTITPTDLPSKKGM